MRSELNNHLLVYASPIFQDLEVAIKGQFDAILDTIGLPETERFSINLLKKGGHYMTLQVLKKYSGVFLFIPH